MQLKLQMQQRTQKRNACCQLVKACTAEAGEHDPNQSKVGSPGVLVFAPSGTAAASMSYGTASNRTKTWQRVPDMDQ
jgi:hypothetical protein